MDEPSLEHQLYRARRSARLAWTVAIVLALAVVGGSWFLRQTELSHLKELHDLEAKHAIEVKNLEMDLFSIQGVVEQLQAELGQEKRRADALADELKALRDRLISTAIGTTRTTTTRP